MLELANLVDVFNLYIQLHELHVHRTSRIVDIWKRNALVAATRLRYISECTVSWVIRSEMY